MTELLALAGNWQAAIAGLVAAALIGFQIYLRTRRDLREDKQGDTSTGAYTSVIAMLQAEIARLSAANIELHKEVDRLNRKCDECKGRTLALEKVIEMRKNPRG